MTHLTVVMVSNGESLDTSCATHNKLLPQPPTTQIAKIDGFLAQIRFGPHLETQRVTKQTAVNLMLTVKAPVQKQIFAVIKKYFAAAYHIYRRSPSLKSLTVWIYRYAYLS